MRSGFHALLITLIGCAPPPGGSGRADAGAPLNFADPASILDVFDGDTIVVQRGPRRLRIRLKGIDTPELNSGDDQLDPEPFSEAARAFTLGRVGIQVGLEWDSACTDPYGNCTEGRDDQACFDRYCRLLGYIRLGDQSDLGEELLRSGLAQVYRFHNEIFDRFGDYLDAEEEARGARRGQWE